MLPRLGVFLIALCLPWTHNQALDTSCREDGDWNAFAAALSAFDDQRRASCVHHPDLDTLPQACLREDPELAAWCLHVAAGFSEGQEPCLYGVASAMACVATMHTCNSMADLASTAPLVVAALRKSVETNSQLLQGLGSSTWPFSLEQVSTVLRLHSAEGDPKRREASVPPLACLEDDAACEGEEAMSNGTKEEAAESDVQLRCLRQYGLDVDFNLPGLPTNLTPACRSDFRAPNPYELESISSLYDEELRHEQLSASELQKRWRRLAQQVDSADCAFREKLLLLLEEGLIIHGPFGVDLSQLVEKRSPTALAMDASLNHLQQVYFPTRLDYFFWRIDLPALFRPPPPTFLSSLAPEELKLLSDFRRDGYVRIGQWYADDAYPRYIEALRASTNSKLEVQNPKSLTFGGPPFEQIPWLQPESLLWKLVFGYFGAAARLNGAEALRVRAVSDKASYNNAAWHHDGCGNRLKAFVFLHDVDEGTHPTLIAGGTHRIRWFPSTNYFAGPGAHNKLNEHLVRQSFNASIRKMLGKAGGGFIFDTNTLHGADLAGEHAQRDVLIFDFSSVEHAEFIPRQERGIDDGCMSSIPHDLCPKPKAGDSVDFDWTGHELKFWTSTRRGLQPAAQ